MQVLRVPRASSESSRAVCRWAIFRVCPRVKRAFLYIIFDTMSDATRWFSPGTPRAASSAFCHAQFAPRQSTSRLIAEALRTAIVEGTLLPGEPLRQDAIARQFSVSAIPVREALRQLESEGWVTSRAEQGRDGRALQSADEAREIYEIRAVAGEPRDRPRDSEQHTAATLRRMPRACCEAARTRAGPVALRRAQRAVSYEPVCARRTARSLMEMIGQLHRRGERYLRLKFGLPDVQGRVRRRARRAARRVVRAAISRRRRRWSRASARHRRTALSFSDRTRAGGSRAREATRKPRAQTPARHSIRELT